MNSEVYAIILTLNEEIHLERCIKSIRDICSSIFVVDSGSSDRTVEIASSLGADVLHNAFVNHSQQMNFATDRLSKRGGWLLRIDADEVLDDTREVKAFLSQSAGIDGLLLRRTIYFMGKRICWGGVEPSWQLRMWRNGAGRCEQRWMDEHIVVDGPVVRSPFILHDINLNSVDWWTNKHNKYASREAIDILMTSPLEDVRNKPASPQAKFKRMIKERVYARLPAGLRSLAYFLYRYFVRLGFLDGAAGYYFHVLQAFWYRTLVDAKVRDIAFYAKEHRVPLIEAVRQRTGFDVSRWEDDNADNTRPKSRLTFSPAAGSSSSGQ